MTYSLCFFSSFDWSRLLFSPEATELLWHLGLPVELHGGGDGHEHVDNHQVVVNWHNFQRILHPNYACQANRHLLIRRDQMRRFFQITDVGNSDHPLECRSPEKDYEN